MDRLIPGLGTFSSVSFCRRCLSVEEEDIGFIALNENF